MTGRPVWLLDVDGVINITRRETAAAWPDVAMFTAMGYPIAWSASMLQRIAKIHADGLAEVRWLTTWEDLANIYLIDQLGLPELVVAGRRPVPDPMHTWWKLPHAQAAYSTGARIVWTDDDIAYDEPANGWLAEIGCERMLAISPRDGLLPGHLDQIEQWLALGAEA